MTKKHKTGPVPPLPAEGPTLREFWMRLQREKAAREASGDAGAEDCGSGGVIGPGSGWRWNRSGGFGSGSGSGWSWRRSGSGSGSGSGGLGYGLDLVVPDHFCRERILLIMRDICAKEEAKE